MYVREVNRREIEERISKMGDYVKIDYLSSCLTKQLDFDSRKFVLVKLAELYESKGMYAEAARLMKGSAEINTTFESKMKEFAKASDLFILAGKFDESDAVFKLALACANERQKFELKEARKNMYFKLGRKQLKEDKRKMALNTYEKINTMDLSFQERDEVKKTLADLYQKLGKIREFMNLKNAKPEQEKKKEVPKPEKKTISAEELIEF